MKIKLTSVYVNDQDKALRFYTEVLGFVKKTEILLGGHGHLISLLLDGMHSCARRIHRRDRTLPGSRNETRGDHETHRRRPTTTIPDSRRQSPPAVSPQIEEAAFSS